MDTSRSEHVGIQSLRKAEDQASQVVSRARQERTSRMKDAKKEAEKEIQNYQAQQDARLKEMQEKRSAGVAALDNLEGDTQTTIQKLSVDCEQNKESVIKMLMGVVTDVHTSVPVARKGI